MYNLLPITIVIPSMNRPESLRRTIEKIMDSDYLPSQIVVVDQSVSEINQILNRNILEYFSNIIECTYFFQAFPSLTKARNTGLRLSSNDIVVFSDDDIDVKENTIVTIHNLMLNRDISLIAGIDENMGEQKSILGYFAYTKSFIKRNKGHITLSIFGRFPSKMTKSTVETEWAMGYFFVIRKSLVEKWQCFWDENLTSYAYPEDLDFSYSYYKKSKCENLRCIISDSVRVKHLVNQDYRIPSYKATLMYVIHREYLSYKHFQNPLSRLATRWSNYCELIYRFLTNKGTEDLIRAIYLCDKYRIALKNQKIPEELFQNI